MKIENEVERFKVWASNQIKVGEWEMDYPGWKSFESAVLHFLGETNSAEWDNNDWQNVLYAIARDNECETFIDIISEDPELLISLGQQAITSNEPDAKWQIAAYLGETAKLEVAEPILLELVDDTDEYVSRRSLLALSILGSKQTERLAKIAWATGHQYQRIAVLHALNNISSEKLEQFLDLAMEDGRSHLVKNAKELQDTVRKRLLQTLAKH